MCVPKGSSATILIASHLGMCSITGEDALRLRFLYRYLTVIYTLFKVPCVICFPVNEARAQTNVLHNASSTAVHSTYRKQEMDEVEKNDVVEQIDLSEITVAEDVGEAETLQKERGIEVDELSILLDLSTQQTSVVLNDVGGMDSQSLKDLPGGMSAVAIESAEIYSKSAQAIPQAQRFGTL